MDADTLFHLFEQAHGKDQERFMEHLEVWYRKKHAPKYEQETIYDTGDPAEVSSIHG